MSTTRKGTLKAGIPYAAVGSGPPVVVINGFPANGKESSLLEKGALRFVAALARTHTVYATTPPAGLSAQTTMADLAAAYAEALDGEFGGPVDVLGISTGGAIALQLAVDHPQVVKRLVLGSAAHRIGPEAVPIYEKCITVALEGRGKAAMRALAPIITTSPVAAAAYGVMTTLMAPMAGIKKGWDPTDMVATLRSELEMDIADRLGDVTAPTLLVTGDGDRCYPLDVAKVTVERIPNARLVVQEGKGHGLSYKRFWPEVLTFLSESET